MVFYGDAVTCERWDVVCGVGAFQDFYHRVLQLFLLQNSTNNNSVWSSFFSIFGARIHRSYFGATGTPVFGFLVASPLGFKA